ncbi:MAG: ATP-dependent RNA helicase HrpA [Rhodanobacteraceae bacterium]|nr:ATP-dependent RNA helicase HrpA [Rhodanobacteraceae bacterium]
MAADFPRLRGDLDRWRADAADADARLAKLGQQIEASAAKGDARRARVPMISVPEELPIAAKAEEITAAIRAHQVVVVAGETGSGKTTQLPKLCLAAGRGLTGLIGCTQPRRIAAKSISRRVAEELKSPLGSLVGFAVRFQDQIGEDTLVKFMTDGILLAETQSDRMLRRYDTLIIDEAHERSLNIDFLLGYLKRLLPKRPDLKVIITSATIDTERFARHFGNAPVISVEGRGYPVEMRWRPIEGDREERGDDGLYRSIAAAADELSREDPRGDILVFLPGEREIRDAHKALEQRRYAHTEVLPLYARLSAAAQDAVFRPGAQRRIVLATNVAETSITVPRIRFVIDSGIARVNRYSQRAKVQRLQIEPISQASANQRAGRCGRLSAGIAVRLYDEADFQRRPAYTDPELLRSSFAGVILRMLDLDLGDPASFPFLDPPSDRALQDGFLLLREVGAIDDGKKLTQIGRDMAKLPIDVRLARALVAARDARVLDEALIIASGLSIQDPRERPPEVRGLADAAHQVFVHEKSDFLTLVQLWQAYNHEHEERTQSQLRDWCRAHFLSYLRMREWRELHRQLLLIVRERGWEQGQRGTRELRTGPRTAGRSPIGTGSGPGPEERARTPDRARKVAAKLSSSPDGGAVPLSVRGPSFAGPNHSSGAAPETALTDPRAYEFLHRALLTAFITQVARKDDKVKYRGPRGRALQIFPGSGQFKVGPNWILSATLLETEKLYALNVARIDPAWIEPAAAHLTTRQFYEPSWDAKGGRAVGFEDVSLYGLPIVQRRRISYGPVDPLAARQLFLRHQLVRGEGPARHALLAHNAAMREQAHAKEEKLRRRGLMRDEEQLAEWFDARCPKDILDSHALDRWLKHAPSAERDALKLTLDDLVIPSARGDERFEFPDALEVQGARLLLQYHFDPQGARDGVTATVPLSVLLALSDAEIDWLVPGLREEKAALLIKSLPKTLRRHVVPAPDFARAFIEAATPRAQPFASALAVFLSRVAGVDIREADFDASTLPAYLSFNLKVVDANGQPLAEGRELAGLKTRFAEAARAAFAARVDADFQREQLSDWPLDEIPLDVRAEGGARAFPALYDQGTHAGLRAYADAAEAAQAHPRGVRRLVLIQVDDQVRYWMRHLKLSSDAQMAYGVVASIDALRRDLIESALDRVIGGAGAGGRGLVKQQRGRGQGREMQRARKCLVAGWVCVGEYKRRSPRPAPAPFQRPHPHRLPGPAGARAPGARAGGAATGRARRRDPAGGQGSAQCAGAAADGLCHRQPRRRPRASGFAGASGLPARGRLRAPGALPALSRRPAPAHRAPEARSGQGSGQAARSAAVLARVAAAVSGAFR